MSSIICLGEANNGVNFFLISWSWGGACLGILDRLNDRSAIWQDLKVGGTTTIAAITPIIASHGVFLSDFGIRATSASFSRADMAWENGGQGRVRSLRSLAPVKRYSTVELGAHSLRWPPAPPDVGVAHCSLATPSMKEVGAPFSPSPSCRVEGGSSQPTLLLEQTVVLKRWAGEGSNLRRALARQLYRLLRLATPAPAPNKCHQVTRHQVTGDLVTL